MPSFVVELHLPLTFPRQAYHLIGYTFPEAFEHARGAARKSGVRASVHILRARPEHTNRSAT